MLFRVTRSVYVWLAHVSLPYAPDVISISTVVTSYLSTGTRPNVAVCHARGKLEFPVAFNSPPRHS